MNIVFLLADDYGLSDLGTNNPKSFYETPNLDRLAAQSVRFTDAMEVGIGGFGTKSAVTREVRHLRGEICATTALGSVPPGPLSVRFRLSLRPA